MIILIQIANEKLSTNPVQKTLIGLSLVRAVNYIIYSSSFLYSFRTQELVKFVFPSTPMAHLTTLKVMIFVNAISAFFCNLSVGMITTIFTLEYLELAIKLRNAVTMEPKDVSVGCNRCLIVTKIMSILLFLGLGATKYSLFVLQKYRLLDNADSDKTLW